MEDNIVSHKSLQDRVEEYVGRDCLVSFSAYEADPYYDALERKDWGGSKKLRTDILRDNLDEVPIKGKIKFISKYAWVQDGHENYESEVVESPTWLEICRFTEEMIKTTGDKHHIFLESVYVDRMEGDIQVVELSMGS